MGIIFKTENRRVIPRLRSFKLSATTGELSILSSNDKEPKFNNSRFLYEQNKAWNNNKTLSHAGDLLSSAYVLGLQSEYLDVAKYIIEIDSNKNSPLLGLAKKILHVTENIYVVAPHDIDLNTKYFKEINVIKQILIKEPKNPIAWMEMGRLYSLLGQIDKANRCVESALFLDKDNRFIARSASRFYHHFSDDKEKALYVIKKSKFLNNDPWLISAEIAYSTILGRFSKLAKVGINYLKNKSYNDHSITELASSLGTLEYDNGNIKEARKYFNQSLIKPNDNSLAQSIWISSNLTGLDIENEQYNLPLAFEAKANHFYEVGSFKHSFEEAMKWHSDEPYSTRPIKLASYISSIFLKEHKKSVALIEKALEITPGDIPLTNNLIYFLAQDKQIGKAVSLFQSHLKSVINETNSKDIDIYIATAGLIAFRTNNPSEGKLHYENAIKIARNNKNNYHIALATANYVKEALKFAESKEELQKLVNQLNDVCKSSKEFDIKEIQKEALKEYSNLISIE